MPGVVSRRIGTRCPASNSYLGVWLNYHSISVLYRGGFPLRDQSWFSCSPPGMAAILSLAYSGKQLALAFLGFSGWGNSHQSTSISLLQLSSQRWLRTPEPTQLPYSVGQKLIPMGRMSRSTLECQALACAK
jgi:hypothetical protein